MSATLTRRWYPRMLFVPLLEKTLYFDPAFRDHVIGIHRQGVDERDIQVIFVTLPDAYGWQVCAILQRIGADGAPSGYASHRLM